MLISKYTIKRVLKEAGANRVKGDAVEALSTKINKIAFEIAVKSVRLAKHAKRKTVETSDVRLAMRDL